MSRLHQIQVQFDALQDRALQTALESLIAIDFIKPPEEEEEPEPAEEETDEKPESDSEDESSSSGEEKEVSPSGKSEEDSE